MKKILILAAAALLALAFAATASATNLEQEAVQAAKNAGCLVGVPNNDIQVSVDVVSSCFVSGFIQVAHVYYVPFSNCKSTPNRPCPKPAVQLKADVTFGCSDEIQSVICY